MERGAESPSEIRLRAELVRREIKLVVDRGGSPAAYLPRVRRAERHVRKGDLEGALRVLTDLDHRLRERLSAAKK